MQLEARLTAPQLEELVRQFLPLELQLDSGEAERLLLVDELSFLRIVPGTGVALGVEGRLRWPLMGLGVPVKFKTVELLVHFGLRRDPSSTLTIGLTIEKADLAWVPDSIDRKITERVQKELLARPIEVGWDFEKLLTHRFSLPDNLRSAEALLLRVHASDFRVTSDALVLGISLGTRVDTRPSLPTLPNAEPAE